MSQPELFQYQQLADVIAPVVVSDPAPAMDWLRQTEIPPADAGHSNVGGESHVIDPGVQTQNISWLRVTETPRWEAEPLTEGMATVPWLSQPVTMGNLLDWLATPPDPVRPLDEPNAGYSVWHIADWIRPLDWIGEAQPPAASAEPLADYGQYTPPTEPIVSQVTPQPHVESQVVWPLDEALPTPSAEVFSLALDLDSLEWQPATEQPQHGPAASVTEGYSGSTDLSLDSLAFTWLQPASEPRWELSPSPVTTAAYVAEPANVGGAGVGWMQPMVNQQWAPAEPITYCVQFDWSDVSTAPEEVLKPDNRNETGI